MKKTYLLIDKTGETINKITTYSLEIAIDLFSQIKKLKTKNLLEIYDIKEEC